MRQVRLSPNARQELEEIVAWLREHRTEQKANAVLDELLAATVQIAALPEAWKRCPKDPQFRSRPLRKLRYSIVYRFTERYIYVGRVRAYAARRSLLA